MVARPKEVTLASEFHQRVQSSGPPGQWNALERWRILVVGRVCQELAPHGVWTR